jgi:hypothetical protein
MNIIELNERQNLSADTKTNRIYIQLEELLNQLRKRNLPENIIESVNQDIEVVNAASLIVNDFRKLVKQKQNKIIKLLEKDLKVVPKNYYRNMWLALGMSVFGLPIGVAFGASIGNMGLLGVGLPIGMAIGALVGSKMDKKALEEGRQLNIEIKY